MVIEALETIVLRALDNTDPSLSEGKDNNANSFRELMPVLPGVRGCRATVM